MLVLDFRQCRKMLDSLLDDVNVKPFKGTSKGKGKEVVIIEATLGDGWKSSKCSGIQHPLSCQGVHSSALRNCSVAVRFRSPYESISELSRLSNVDLEFLLVISFMVFSFIGGFKRIT